MSDLLNLLAFPQMVRDAHYYRADYEGRGGGRVPDAYNDLAANNALLTYPNSSDPSRIRMSAAEFRDYLLDQLKRNRTANPFAVSEAQLNAAYPASGISPDHAVRYINTLTAMGGP